MVDMHLANEGLAEVPAPAHNTGKPDTVPNPKHTVSEVVTQTPAEDLNVGAQNVSHEEHADTPHSDQVDDARATLLEAAASQPSTLVKPIDAPAKPDMAVISLIKQADHSAGKLVNLLAKHFPCFRDETRFDGRKVRFFKRAQIFVADLWAAFNGTGYGEFDDVGHLTMFAGTCASRLLRSGASAA